MERCLSVIALLSLVGRSVLEASYVVPKDFRDAGKGMVALWIVLMGW